MSAARVPPGGDGPEGDKKEGTADAAVAKQRLTDYSGVEGTDDSGRQLDRREFGRRRGRPASSVNTIRYEECGIAIVSENARHRTGIGKRAQPRVDRSPHP